jgi:hypothetical protein
MKCAEQILAKMLGGIMPDGHDAYAQGERAQRYNVNSDAQYSK